MRVLLERLKHNTWRKEVHSQVWRKGASILIRFTILKPDANRILLRMLTNHCQQVAILLHFLQSNSYRRRILCLDARNFLVPLLEHLLNGTGVVSVSAAFLSSQTYLL